MSGSLYTGLTYTWVSPLIIITVTTIVILQENFITQ